MDNKIYSNKNRMDISDIHKRVLGDNKAYIDDKVLIVDECSIDEGIEARVVSAFMANEKEICVIFTLRDTTGEKKLTKGSMISYCTIESENLFCGSRTSYGIIEVDEKTNTAIYSVNSHSDAGVGENIILKIKDIQQFVWDSVDCDILENIDIYTKVKGHQPKLIKQTDVKCNGFSHRNGIEHNDVAKMDLLNIDEMNIPFESIDWAKISNIGFVDNMFHIQVKLLLDRKSRVFLGLNIENADNEYKDYDNRAYENRKYCEIDFYEESKYDEESRLGCIYQEYIYTDITDVSQLKDIVVTINYINGGKDIPVSYTFEFSKPDTLTSNTVAKNVDIIISEAEVIADEISISPLGLSVIGRSYEDIFSKYDVTDDVYIVYKDGNKEKLVSGPGSASLESDVCHIRTTYVPTDRSPISMDGIDQVVINGSVFELE